MFFPIDGVDSSEAKTERSRVFRNSIAARLVCRTWSPFRPNEKTPPATDRRRLAQSGAVFGRSEDFRMDSQLRQKNTEGDTADVARGRLGSRGSFFVTAPQVDSGGAKTEPTLPKGAASPNYLVALGLRST